MAINLELVGKQSDPEIYEYDWRQCVLYALGVGAGNAEVDELPFLFEGAEGGLAVLPTFAVIPSFRALISVTMNLNVNPMAILHGEQKIVLHRPIPESGTMSTTSEVTGIYDKTKGALAVVEARTTIAGEPVFDNVFSIFVKGEGGFGGDRGPAPVQADPPEDRAPDFRVEYPTLPQQALLYRLSGDTNPIHAAPQFAAMAGFEKPILHGLCTFGHVGRAILHSACDGDPARLRSFAARFASVVYPGDTIITEGWKQDDGTCIVRAGTQRGNVVLSNALVEIAA